MQFSGAFENPNWRARSSLPKQINKLSRLGTRQLFPLCNTLNADIFMLPPYMSASPHLPLTRRARRASTWCFNGVSSPFHLINHLTSPSQNTLPACRATAAWAWHPSYQRPSCLPPAGGVAGSESRQHAGGQPGQRGSWQRVHHFQSARPGLPSFLALALLLDAREPSSPAPECSSPTMSQVANVLLEARGDPLRGSSLPSHVSWGGQPAWRMHAGSPLWARGRDGLSPFPSFRCQ